MDQDLTLENRRKAKQNGEEDPVVVAQRFLNIYRQLHIFNSQKKSEFDKMLLELPLHVKSVFRQLPGGILLQEYIDKLSENGESIVSQASYTEAMKENDGGSQILAAALADADAKPQSMATQNFIPVNKEPPIISSAQVSVDKNFAQDLAGAMAAALGSKNNDMSTIEKLLDTFGRSQSELLKSLQSDNLVNQTEMRKISKNLAQTQASIAQSLANKRSEEDTKRVIFLLAEKQKHTLEKLAEIEAIAKQTSIHPDLSLAIKQSEKTFGKLFIALHEKQKTNLDSVAKMLVQSQQNMAKLLVQHNSLSQNNTNASAANNIQINNSDYSEVLGRIADKLSRLQTPVQASKIEVNFPKDLFKDFLKSQQELSQKQNENMVRMIANAIKEGQEASTKSIVNAISKQGSIKVFTPIATAPQTLDNNYNDINVEEAISENTNEPLTSDFAIEQNDFIETTESSFEEEKPKKKKKKKKKKKETDDSVIEALKTNNTFDDFDTESNVENFFEDISPASDSDENTMFDVIANSELQKTENDDSTNLTTIDDTSAEDSVKNIWTSTEDEDKELNKWGFDSFNDKIITDFDTPDDWGFGSTSQEDSNTEISIGAVSEEMPDENWEWEYTEITDDVTDVHSSDLSLINKNMSLWSGDLFFYQPTKNISTSETQTFPPLFMHAPLIVDSTTSDNNFDPYKISSQKD